MNLVSVHDFDEVIDRILSEIEAAPQRPAGVSPEKAIFFDLETTGLNPHKGDRFFSIALGTLTETYYFNFKPYPEFDNEEYVLDMDFHFKILREQIFEANLPGAVFVGHNLKFDLSMLKASGCEVIGDLHCTQVTARVLDSDLMPGTLSLDDLGSKIGFPKDAKVKAYILKNKLYTERVSEWTASSSKHLHFERVPFQIISSYACRDIDVTRALFLDQIKRLSEIALAIPADFPSIWQVYRNEQKLVRTVFEMEYGGVKIDTDFCIRALAKAKRDRVDAEIRFKELSGHDYMRSNLLFQKLFESEKDKWVWGEPTKTGQVNPCFDAEVLKTFSNPLAGVILQHSDAKKEIEYYAGFLEAADPMGYIHTSFNQEGTVTGRFSSSNPNLQNMAKAEDDELLEEFVVRRAIVPSEPGYVLHALDYKQMEYRVLLDYAGGIAQGPVGVKRLIEKVNTGHDVHEATGQGAGVSRQTAKKVNFSIIYGSGDNALSESLKVPLSQAVAIKNAIFQASPEIYNLISSVRQRVKLRGYVINWFGRILQIRDPRFSYRGTNYLIQGGCADIVKLAMNRIRDYLIEGGFKTKMRLTIHDELVFDGPLDEAEIVIPTAAKIMETAFPAKLCPLGVDIEHSFRSLADKSEGIARESRDQVSKKSDEANQSTTEHGGLFHPASSAGGDAGYALVH